MQGHNFRRRRTPALTREEAIEAARECMEVFALTSAGSSRGAHRRQSFISFSSGERVRSHGSGAVGDHFLGHGQSVWAHEVARTAFSTTELPVSERGQHVRSSGGAAGLAGIL